MSLMWASKAGSVAAVGDMRVGGLYFTLGIWLQSSGMLPRICTKADSTGGLLESRGLSSTICSVSTKFATVPCTKPALTASEVQTCSPKPPPHNKPAAYALHVCKSQLVRAA